MKSKVIQRIVSCLVVATVLSILSVTALASNRTTDYTLYDAPGSSDYAYWNGFRVIKASGTTVSEMKWMQASLNWCIANLDLPGDYLEVDGSLGPASRKVVLEFQKAAGLTQDGSFGPACISTMKDILNGKRALTWINAPETVKIAAGDTVTVKITFGGVPISSVSGYYSGDGITARFAKVTWSSECSAVLSISADDSFTDKGSITFQLVNNKTGVLMSKTITLNPKVNGGKYQPDKALEYASAHWNDGKGECATFVSHCLQGGGLDVYSESCTYLLSALEKKNYGSLTKLTVSKDGYISVAENSGNIYKGDLIFCYCPNHTRPYTHVYICSGVDKNGHITGYAHNNPLNGTIKAKTCGYCHESLDGVYVFHIDA